VRFHFIMYLMIVTWVVERERVIEQSNCSTGLDVVSLNCCANLSHPLIRAVTTRTHKHKNTDVHVQTREHTFPERVDWYENTASECV
jgi:uncharacterized protein (UPF0218 family)